jgi:hypothetical protein
MSQSREPYSVARPITLGDSKKMAEDTREVTRYLARSTCAARGVARVMASGHHVPDRQGEQRPKVVSLILGVGRP